MEPNDVERRIRQAMPRARVQVTGKDAHFSAVVVAPEFEGKSRLEQHRMIYALFHEEMASQAIHALALETAAPSEREGPRAG